MRSPVESPRIWLSYPQIVSRGSIWGPLGEQDRSMNPQEIVRSVPFSTAQAKASGLSRRDLARALAAGEVVRVKRGWYGGTDTPWPADRHRNLVNVVLRDRPGLVASHYSALALLGLPLHRPDWSVVHLMRTEPGRGQSRPGLRIHRQVQGCKAVRPALAIAQTALLCPVSALMSLDAALRAHVVSARDYDEVIPKLAGRRGCIRLGLVGRLANGRRESPLESWAALVLDGLSFTLDPQYEVPGTPYRADARIRGTRVLIECDGESKYEDRRSLFAEKLREDEIRQRGWEVVRVTAGLLDDPGTLRSRVLAALARASRRAAA